MKRKDHNLIAFVLSRSIDILTYEQRAKLAERFEEVLEQDDDFSPSTFFFRSGINK